MAFSSQLSSSAYSIPDTNTTIVLNFGVVVSGKTSSSAVSGDGYESGFGGGRREHNRVNRDRDSFLRLTHQLD